MPAELLRMGRLVTIPRVAHHNEFCLVYLKSHVIKSERIKHLLAYLTSQQPIRSRHHNRKRPSILESKHLSRRLSKASRQVRMVEPGEVYSIMNQDLLRRIRRSYIDLVALFPHLSASFRIDYCPRVLCPAIFWVYAIYFV